MAEIALAVFLLFAAQGIPSCHNGAVHFEYGINLGGIYLPALGGGEGDVVIAIDQGVHQPCLWPDAGSQMYYHTPPLSKQVPPYDFTKPVVWRCKQDDSCGDFHIQVGAGQGQIGNLPCTKTVACIYDGEWTGKVTMHRIHTPHKTYLYVTDGWLSGTYSDIFHPMPLSGVIAHFHQESLDYHCPLNFCGEGWAGGTLQIILGVQ